MYTSHCSSGKCVSLYSCQWNCIWALALCMQSHGALAITTCVPSWSCIYCRTYRINVTCQHHWAFVVVPCWGWYVSAAEWWVTRHAVTFAPMGKPENMQWKHPILPHTKKTACHKHMLVKWCWQCSSTVKDPCLWKSHNATVSWNWYCQTPKELHTEAKNKCHSELTNGIILLHNAHPHVAHRVQDQLHSMQWWELLKHTAYSMDLPLCHFHVFGSLTTIKESKHNPNCQHHGRRFKSFHKSTNIKFL